MIKCMKIMQSIKNKKSKNELKNVKYKWFESLNDFSKTWRKNQSNDSLIIPHRKFLNNFNVDVAVVGGSKVKFEKLRSGDDLKLR